MIRICLFLICCLFSSLSMFANTIKFNTERECKIIQFTDIHYDSQRPENSDKSLKMMDLVLDKERPEVVIFTGDVVVGKNTENDWDEVLRPVNSRNIPFAIALGNHDDEQGLTISEIYQLMSKYPLCLNSAKKAKDNHDDVIKVMSSDSDSVKALLYVFYSNSYSTINDVKGYGWLTPQQISNYNKTSNKFKRKNNDVSLPSLAFLHIPLPEYSKAYDQKSCTGVKLEKECSPQINTGLFASMKINGDVMGVFCGHDHNNDYLAELDGIALAYGRFSGSKNTYTDLENGARIIVLKEDCRQFSTSVILNDGNIKDEFEYPSSAIKAMTFNVRYDNPDDGENRWDNRRDAVINAVRDNDVDLLGTQELLNNQVLYMNSKLKGYSQVGVGRIDGVDKGEYSAIFYKSNRFSLLDSGNFWLSEKPHEVGVKGWDAACERIATWALLKDQRTNQNIFFINVHLDHVGVKAQAESLKLVKRKIKELSKENGNILVTGDFNMTPDNKSIIGFIKKDKTLDLINCSDAYVDGPKWTFHNYGRIVENERPTIDYIFVNKDALIKNYNVVFDPAQKPYISDHAPVITEILFK